MSIKSKSPVVEQFNSEPTVKALLGSCKNFIAFAKQHIDEPDGLALIKKQLSPIVVPMELYASITDLWEDTIQALKL